MTTGRLTIASLAGFVLLVAMKVLALMEVNWIWLPLIDIGNYVVAAFVVLAVMTAFKSRVTSLAEFLDTLESLGLLLARLVRRAFSSTRRTQTVPRPSFSGWLVSAAVQRLPAAMNHLERHRWEEEMMADVASVPRRRRLRVAFSIWRKGAPGMPVGGEHAPHSAD